MTPETVRSILRSQGMPADEVRVVVSADDPTLVRRLLELHRERLVEWVAEQRELVGSIERALVGFAS